MIVTNLTNSGIRVSLLDGSVLSLLVGRKGVSVSDDLITDELRRFSKLGYVLLEKEPPVVNETTQVEDTPVSEPVEVKKPTTKKRTTKKSTNIESKGVKTNE